MLIIKNLMIQMDHTELHGDGVQQRMMNGLIMNIHPGQRWNNPDLM